MNVAFIVRSDRALRRWVRAVPSGVRDCLDCLFFFDMGMTSIQKDCTPSMSAVRGEHTAQPELFLNSQ